MIPVFKRRDGLYGIRVLVSEEQKVQSLAVLFDTRSEDLFFGVRNFWASVPFCIDIEEHYLDMDEECYQLMLPPRSSTLTLFTSGFVDGGCRFEFLRYHPLVLLPSPSLSMRLRIVY
jgi:hypothetical protein